MDYLAEIIANSLVVLVGLKLLGIVAFSWFWILTPLWLPILIGTVITIWPWLCDVFRIPPKYPHENS